MGAFSLIVVINLLNRAMTDNIGFRGNENDTVDEYPEGNTNGGEIYDNTSESHEIITTVEDSEEPGPPDMLNLNSFPNDPAFEEIVREAELAIAIGVHPIRIKQGSSGSYFVQNTRKENIAVFKPKSEEPYSAQNPKYGKWCQRVFCPCCFGRNCLLKNQGYLSEAGASLVDEWLGLNIVPKTRIVWLASETFFYSKITKAKCSAKRGIMATTPAIGRRFKRLGLPLKVGSFQLFMKDHSSAEDILKRFSYETLPGKSMNEFQLQFEKLVILDYIVRNTDRGNDNWLVKVDLEDRSQMSQADYINDGLGKENDYMSGAGDQRNPWNVVNTPKISIAAIDNGLAFPYKHPDTWRAYPYHWAWLQPYAETPFSEETVQTFLPMIRDLRNVEALISELENLFSIDNDFSKSMFDKQMSLLRGQIMNLCEALDKRMSPSDLVELPLRIVERKTIRQDSHSINERDGGEFRETYQEKRPFFTWC